MDECILIPNAKDLVRRMLEFEPTKRLQLKNLRHQEVFKVGYTPTALTEVAFDRVPDLTTDGKCKAIPSESGQMANTKARLDSYCDLAILYRNTDSYKADF